MKATNRITSIPKRAPIGRVCALFALCLGLLWSTGSHAGKYVLHKDWELVLDTTSGLIWERCPVGMKMYKSWYAFCADENDKEVKSAKAIVSFPRATSAPPDMDAGFPAHLRGGWRLPTAREWASLLECRSGYSKSLDVGDGSEPIRHTCNQWLFSAIKDVNTFPFTAEGPFWTSTPVLSKNGQATGAQWVMYMVSGFLDTSADMSSGKAAVLMVRSSNLKNPKAIAEAGFTRQVESFSEEQARNEKAKLQAQEEEARQDQARRAQAAQRRQSVLNGLLNSGAQSVYLQAGKAERNGGIQVEGEHFNATELYEALIDKFPNSPFAAKANDQLLANQRESKARARLDDARYEQGRRAYEACKIEMDACYQRNSYKGNCWRDCEKLR